MGNFLDQTARATEAQNALSALTENGSTLTTISSPSRHFEHTIQAFVETQWGGLEPK